MFKLLKRREAPIGNFTMPGREYDALVGGAMTMVVELKRIVQEARHEIRLVEIQNGVITQTLLETTLNKLYAADDKVREQMETEIANSTNTGSTIWNVESHEKCVSPNYLVIRAPKVAIDAVTIWVNRGAKSAKLVHEMLLAEIDLTIARWYVMANACLITKDINEVKDEV